VNYFIISKTYGSNHKKVRQLKAMLITVMSSQIGKFQPFHDHILAKVPFLLNSPFIQTLE